MSLVVMLTGGGTSGGDRVLRTLKAEGIVAEELQRNESAFDWSMKVVLSPENDAAGRLAALRKAGALQFTTECLDAVYVLSETKEDIQLDTKNTQYMNHVRETAQKVGGDVFQDIDHQVKKYGAQRVDGFGWLAILTEEFGETAQAYLKKDYGEAIAEARQTIACLSRFITEVERERDGTADQERDLYERAQ